MNKKPSATHIPMAYLSLLAVICALLVPLPLQAQIQVEVEGNANTEDLDVNGSVHVVGGYVGIGTSAPELPLHVYTGDAGTPPDWVEGNDSVLIEDNWTPIMQFFGASDKSAWIEFSDNERGRGCIGYKHAYDQMKFFTSGLDQMTIGSNGVLTNVALYNNGVTGDALGITDTGVIGKLNTSSIRYKENVRDVQDSDTRYIYTLRPRMFDYKAPLEGTNQCGLIAEEVEKIAPQLVGYRTNVTYPAPAPGQMKEDVEPIVTKTNEPDTVRYSQLIVPMLAEMQKMRAEIDALKQEVAALKAAK